MSDKPDERRKHQRVAVELSGHIACHVSGKPVVLTSKNMSCSGLYCHVPQFVPPFMRVSLTMALPVHEEEKRHMETLQVEGVTVRTEPEYEEPDRKDYHLAIFFSSITQRGRELIAQYVRENQPRAGVA
jgi:hypothetical protein